MPLATDQHRARRRLIELVQLLLLHKQLSASVLSGESDPAAARRRMAAWVTQQLQQRVRPQDRVPAADWRSLADAVRRRALTAAESDDLHRALIRRCLGAAEILAPA